MRGKSKTPKLIEFKGTTLPVVTASLRSVDVQALQAELEQMLGKTPDFFSGDPAVLDLAEVSDIPSQVDWPALIALLKRHALNPVAVRNAGAAQEAALAAGLTLAMGLETRTTPVPAPAPVPAQVAAAPEPEPAPQAVPAAQPAKAPTLIVDKPLRSGQRVYAQGGDLIVLAMVSAGAEAIADGNIHIYAPLRGRALAGAHGDHSARIFTTAMGAELVSIAGVYRTFEQGIPADVAGKPAQIQMVQSNEGERLLIQPLKIA